MISAPRPPLFFAALPLPCIIQTKQQKRKRSGNEAILVSYFLSMEFWYFLIVTINIDIYDSLLLQNGVTALMIASYQGHSHVVEVLTKFKHNVNLQTKVCYVAV